MKIGDRVIINYDQHSTKNGKSGMICDISTSGLMILVSFDDWSADWFAKSNLEIDLSYYRDLKINELLK